MCKKNLIIIVLWLGLALSAFGLEVDPFADSCFVYRGDCNHSGDPNPIDITDLTYFVDFMFVGGAEPVCLMEGDIDASGELDISDLTWLVDYMFLGGQEPPPDAGKDYVVYFWEGAGGSLKYYGYHVLTRSVDSFSLGFLAWKDMVLSPSGDILYVADTSSVQVVDLATKIVSAVLPYKAVGGLALSEDGEQLAIGGLELYIVNTSDYSVIFHDSTRVDGGVFSSDGLTYYGSANGWLYRVDLDSAYVHPLRSFMGGAIHWIVPSNDELTWFLYQFCGISCAHFSVYDVLSDSITFQQFIGPGVGYLTKTQDETCIFYSYPGSWIGGQGPSRFGVYEISTQDTMLVSTVGIPDCMPYPDYFPIGEIVVTPDSRWLVATGGLGWGGPILLNLETMEIEDCVFLGNNLAWYFLTCQKGL